MIASLSLIHPHSSAFISGCVLLLAVAATVASAAGLDFEILDKVNWRGEASTTASTRVTETYRYDPVADTLTVSAKFDRKGFAPLPPMLALAIQQGFPIQVDPRPESPGPVCMLGPLTGVKDTDAYTWQLKGLSKYVLSRQIPAAGQASPALVNELTAQVARITQAGHLRPWLFLVNVPGSGAAERGDVYWDNPGEVLYLVAEILPLLRPEDARKLREWMRSERQTFAPESMSTMPYGDGAAREPVSPDKRLIAQWQDKTLAFRTKGPVGAWNLYGLACYYDCTGEKPTPQVMARCTDIVKAQLEHRDWATLYWQRGYTPAFNAIHGVNQLFAGYVGYIRLARLAGDSEAESLGWGLLGRTAALRFAMGKYTQFLHDTHQFNPGYGIGKKNVEFLAEPQTIQVETDAAKYAIPKDPAWWVKAHAGIWMGELVTWSWTRPIDNVRQVERLDETGVDVWEWGGVDCGGTGQKRLNDPRKGFWYKRICPHLLPFRDMTPELAEFLGDHLKPEVRAFCDRIVENQPHWYLTYAEAILSAEISFNLPCDAYGHFLARAWILKETPQTLEKYVDVPWAPTGDLYYLHKLAETIKATNRN